MLQPGWALRVVGIHVRRLGHGQGVKEWTCQQLRSEAPSRTPLQTGSHLHFRSSLSTFLGISIFTQNSRNFKDRHFKFWKEN